jgi:hypothetical protein
MAIYNNEDIPISFECSELIEELKQDIAEFGAQKIFAVWLRKYKELGVELIVNYDFVENEAPITPEEINPGERIVYMQADILLKSLEQQNSII